MKIFLVFGLFFVSVVQAIADGSATSLTGPSHFGQQTPSGGKP
ncbi:MAG: hypothetical protein U0Z75_05080 [Deinococcaceae bacterium]